MKHTATTILAFAALGVGLMKSLGASDLVCLVVVLVALYWAIQTLEQRINKLEAKDANEHIVALKQGMENLKGRLYRFENPKHLTYGELKELREAIFTDPPPEGSLRAELDAALSANRNSR